MEPTHHTGASPAYPHAVGPVPLYGRALDQDADALYAALRRDRRPVVVVEIAPGVVGRLVLGHREVLEVIWNAELYSSDPRRWNAMTRGTLPPDAPLAPLLRPRPAAVRLDGAEHLRHRRALTETLGRVDLRRLGHLVRRRAHLLVDGWAARGAADLMADFAGPLVWRVFADLLGLAEESADRFGALAGTVVHAFPEAGRAETQLVDSLRRLVVGRTAAPGPDLSSWLVQESPLTDDETAHNLLSLALIGGTGTIGLIGNALRLLLAHDRPGLLATRDRSASHLVELALCAHAPLPNMAGRWATAHTVLAGHRIQAGDLVIPCLSAANAELAQQDTPVSHTRAHLAWGTGTHGCPAKDAARIITEGALTVLLDRLHDIRLIRADAAPHSSSLWSGAPAKLPVVFFTAGPEVEGRGAVHVTPALMDAPELRRSEHPVAETPSERWSWWRSFGSW
ncbi:cytochrome P450 [Streptomyces sp. NPDC047028]|uniref:cytochrome P450 n=1 Tax=Streptomyces sp. NPDC047028 TaxID=3155793 RepID=UPI0033CD0E75